MSPDIISLGELLVEFIRTELNTPHGTLGAIYRGPFPSGAPANFIDSAARMSKPFKFSTGFIGVIGNDEFGECVIKKLEQDNVDISQIRIVEGETTGIAFNQYNSDGSRKFIFARGAAGKTSTEDIKKSYFKDVKNLHIMGSALSISKTSLDACLKAINLAKKNNPNVVISFDPNIRPEMLDLDEILENIMPVIETTEIILPSEEEAEMITRINGPKKACQKLLEMGPKIVVLKQGKKGCTIFSPHRFNGEVIQGFAANERDPTGAGDSFGGAFIVGYLVGWDLKKIGLFSNAAGALKVEYFGPMPATSYEEVINLMEKS